MTPKEIVELFYNDKTEYLQTCLDENSSIFVTDKTKSLNLNTGQKEIMAEIVDGILTDVYYSILLGIDDCASIGRYQNTYKLYDENNNLITNGGELEGHVWEFFHNQK